VHIKKGKVVASGMGKAGQIALNIATTFSATGTPAIFLHPSDAQHGDLGVIQPDDVLLLVSNSGKTREIIELYELVKMLGYHLGVIVTTGNPESERQSG
jgi:arabinose-5-phosphate isomerase